MKAKTRSQLSCWPKSKPRSEPGMRPGPSPSPAWGKSHAVSLRFLTHESPWLSLRCPNRQEHTEEPGGHGKREPP